MQIPVMAIVDSNCDPLGVDMTIPGNDDALRAISLYCEKVAEACNEGAEAFNQRVLEEDKATAVQEEEEAPKAGKRVVEITQPARRPARMERMAEERKKEEEAAVAPEAAQPEGEAAAVGAAPTEPEAEPEASAD